ncbi:MAG TPA: PQQ-binding-like beta-propeller repeat protein [Nitrospira sp.]|nr:PQQ-binding-like beta-propeller repeat protein [Nitrospira sp.]
MIRPFVRIAAATMCGAIVLATTPAIGAWERFHGDAANRGFADVDTKPAAGGSLSVPGLGTFALGAGPVIAPNGSVYLGTQEGKLIALHADGKPFWSRQIQADESIVASPAIGADGSVYVIGAKSKTTKIGTIKKTEIGSTLYAYNSTGALLARTPFPKQGLRAATTAPPNIVNTGGREIILAPALYKNPTVKNGVDVRLIGFSTSGGVVLNRLVAPQPGVDVVTGHGPSASDLFCVVPIIGSTYCLLTKDFSFNPERVPNPAPMPGVAVFTGSGGGAPHVIVSDQRHTIVDFTVTGSQPRLTQVFRDGDPQRQLFSPPMVLPDGHTLDTTAGEQIIFSGPNANKLAPLASPGIVYGPATLTVNGFAVVVGTNGLSLLKDGQIVSQASLPPTYTSAAASRTHVFVSTTDAFVTFDADAQLELQRFDWVGGGKSPPAIGPDGRVYAIASDILFIFPPPLKVSTPLLLAPGGVLQKEPGGQ